MMEIISDERLAEIRAGLDASEPDCYLLMKRGLFYGPNNSGYTGIREKAGRYTKAEALEHCDAASGVSLVHYRDAQEFSKDCYDDLSRAHLTAKLKAANDALRALLARLDKAEARLSLASTFWLNGSIAIERRANDSWAIKDGGNVLGADGEWEYEPFPSSRTDEFIARTRFTLDDAFHRAQNVLPPPPSSES